MQSLRTNFLPARPCLGLLLLFWLQSTVASILLAQMVPVASSEPTATTNGIPELLLRGGIVVADNTLK